MTTGHGCSSAPAPGAERGVTRLPVLNLCVAQHALALLCMLHTDVAASSCRRHVVQFLAPSPSPSPGSSRSQLASRLLEDALRTLPCQDPMADDATWRAAKSDPARTQGLRLALAAFQASRQLAAQGEAGAEDWEVLLSQARCMRKLGQAPADWLPLLARACHVAAADGGVLLPLYKLHAARMRLLLALPSAQRWASSNGAARPSSRSRSRQGRDADPQQERALLQLVASYCFLPSTPVQLASQGKLLGPEAGEGDRPTAEGRQELWNGLLGDCCAAMQWVQEKDRAFHRAAHRWAWPGGWAWLGHAGWAQQFCLAGGWPLCRTTVCTVHNRSMSAA